VLDMPTENLRTDRYEEELAKRLIRAHKALKEFDKIKRDSNADIYDAKHMTIDFKVGDEVKVYQPRFGGDDKGKPKKLIVMWEGPYKVLSKKSDVVYKVEGKDGARTVHVKRLRLWHRLRMLNRLTEPQSKEAGVDAKEAGDLEEGEEKEEEKEAVAPENKRLERDSALIVGRCAILKRELDETFTLGKFRMWDQKEPTRAWFEMLMSTSKDTVATAKKVWHRAYCQDEEGQVLVPDPKKGRFGVKWIDAEVDEIIVQNWNLKAKRIPTDVWVEAKELLLARGIDA